MINYKLNYVYIEDKRDYKISDIFNDKHLFSAATEKYWYESGWIGDQGDTSECTAYSWTGHVTDSIINEDYISKLPKPIWNIDDLYEKFKRNDGIPGTNYDGSTVRAGAKVLQQLGIIEEYRFCESIDDMVKTLLTIGPIVCGTTWYTKMFTPDHNYRISVDGSPAGGHAYVINGVDTVKKLFRIKNSWGTAWGDNGHAYISFDDFDKLIKEGGEICVPLDKKIVAIPDFSSTTDNDVA